MATSSRQSALFGTNDWKSLYKTLRQADFQSYDYDTLRKSFVDYIKTTYPESFNDYVESSEFIALLDVMAYMGQALAFRNDLNSRENFIDTAERRDSVTKLANLVGYTPKRNLTGQGYLKVTSIRTTENVNDLNGFNLSGVPIIWNDPANTFWQEQFNTIINSALINTQRVGRPGNSSVILGTKTDEYSINTLPNSEPVYPFSATVDGVQMPFELVSVSSINSDVVYELPPATSSLFNILYRNDKLGFGSSNTGFFMYFKQGNLGSYDFSIDQQIANQIIDVNVQGINDNDVWLYQIDTLSNQIIQWEKVDSVYSSNRATNKRIFSVESRVNDQISYSFGDGVFSEIPTGQFRGYYRYGNGLQYTIDPSEISGTTVSIPYVNRHGRTETLTLVLELTSPISNSQGRESIDSIKERAPSRYYTQNRMVNGEDYNNFPYTLYNSIIKSKALNRTSVGVTRNLDLLDPTGKFSSTISFADDGACYSDNSLSNLNLKVNDLNDVAEFFTTTLRKILSENRAIQHYLSSYPRYSLQINEGEDSDNNTYWKRMSVNSNSTTGYFYIITGSDAAPVKLPKSVGTYSSTSLKYALKGATIKFSAPIGYYFNTSGRMVAGLPGPTDRTELWTTVTSVIGDGFNNGDGGFSDNTGPISVAGFVPDGAIATTIIPSFANTLSNNIIQQCIRRIEVNQSFSLIYDNSLSPIEERWAIVSYPSNSYFVNFISSGNGQYTVVVRGTAYYFSSIGSTRFTFNADKIVYDPLSGSVKNDAVTVLKTNSQPNSNSALKNDLDLYVIGQHTQSDGYVDDFTVEITNIKDGASYNPDFFAELTGINTSKSWTFMRKFTDASLLSRSTVIPSSEVIYAYGLRTQIEEFKYDYPPNQLFYATVENSFYRSISDKTSANILSLIPQSEYFAKIGRSGLSFQYKHYANNTVRINPSTSNLIDLYIVSQEYYTAYRNWANDSTNTVIKPLVPDTYELNQHYSKLQDYKMISDNVILNSVKFKPLFGAKADANLRATIKVSKTSNTSVSDGEIKSMVLSAINNYFSIDKWDFGDTFYFSELASYLHSTMGDYISSAVLVPVDTNLSFGDLYEIRCAPYEIFVSAATAADISIITSITPNELRISR